MQKLIANKECSDILTFLLLLVLLILLTSSRGEEENTKPYELMTIKNIKHAVTTQLNRCSTILKNVTCQYVSFYDLVCV